MKRISLKSMGKDTLIYGLGNSMKKIIGFLLIPIYTRYLSPADFGVLSTLSTMTFLISVFASLGLGTSTTRYFFEAEGNEEKGKVLYTSLIITIISNGLLIAILLPFSKIISSILFNSAKYESVVLVSLLLLLLNNVNKQQENIFWYNRKALKYQLIIITRAIINPLLCVIFVVVVKLGIFGIQLGTIISGIVILLLMYFTYTKYIYISTYSKGWAKKLLILGFPIIWHSIAMWIYSVSDRLFLLHYRDLSEVGLYSIGFKFSQPIQILNSAIGMGTAANILLRYQTEKSIKKEETKKLNRQVWHSYIIISVPLAYVISAFSVNILQLMTTEEYIYGALAMPFLLFGFVIRRSTDFTAIGMTLKERTKPLAILMIITALLNIILNIFAIPRLGFIGAALTTIICNYVYFIAAYIYSQKYFYVKRKMIRVQLYILTALGLALYFPFSEIKYDYENVLAIKLVSVLFILILPFLLRIADFRNIKKLLLERVRSA